MRAKLQRKLAWLEKREDDRARRLGTEECLALELTAEEAAAATLRTMLSTAVGQLEASGIELKRREASFSNHSAELRAAEAALVDEGPPGKWHARMTGSMSVD